MHFVATLYVELGMRVDPKRLKDRGKVTAKLSTHLGLGRVAL